MQANTVAVDLAKSIFQAAVADSQWRAIERHRLTRPQFERFFVNRAVSAVVMEACGLVMCGSASDVDLGFHE